MLGSHLIISPILTLNKRIIRRTKITETVSNKIEYAEPLDQLSFMLNH